MAFHGNYANFVFPGLSDPFDGALSSTYSQHLYPDRFPQCVKVIGEGAQSFISWAEPGATRGEHFHVYKVERFLVVEGKARIAMRKVLTYENHAFNVTGAIPACVDMPTLWTHNITNTGTKPLLTVFWTHDMFGLSAPDTYADKVGEDTA